MTDDIVNRLRKLELTLMCNGADGHGFLIKEAADEIEKLRNNLMDAHQSSHYGKLIDRSYNDRKDEEIARLKELVRFQNLQLNGIYRAVMDEGSHPEFHRALMKKHRKEWPVLWTNIDFALETLAQKPPQRWPRKD